MDSSTAQHHHQEMGLQTLESMLGCSKAQQEKKPRPDDMNSLKCPRCDSTNTKFCYYNNYSLSQPRYFCKSCRRYWTKGGTLRSVPVGGGCRRNKRSSSSSSSPSSSKRSQDQPIQSPMPPLSYDSNDLSLAIARLQKHNSGHCDDRNFSIWGHPRMAHHHHQSHGDILGSFGANPPSSWMFDAIRSGFLENPAGGNGIGNVYHGMGNGNVEVENGVMGMSGAHEMGIEYDEYGASTTMASTTAVKQEMCGGARDGEGRISWCFPWPGVGGDGNGSDFDPTRLNWNGLASSSWQGLLNSPLM